MTTDDNPPHQNHDNPPIKKKVVIYNLLMEGYHASRIAKLLKISKQAVAKHIKVLVRAGKIKQISNKPALYAKVLHDNPPLKPVRYDNPTGTQKPTILPHHYGAIFAMVGKPNLNYDRYGKAHDIKQASYATQFGRYKVQIWLKSFRGVSPKEIRENAFQDIMALANKYQAKYEIKLTLIKINTNIEWVIEDEETSKKIADSIGLERGEGRLVANVWHKNGDSTHDNIEFIPTKQFPTGATEHADVHHYVYSGGLDKTLREIANTIIAINQGQIAITEQLKKKGIM